MYVTDYFDRCFLHLQHRVDMAIIKTLKPSVDLGRVHVYLNRFPHPPYVLDEWRGDSARILSVVIFVTFLFYIISIANDVTNDKEVKMRVRVKVHLPAGSRWRLCALTSL